jgi:hypothetical protein
MLYTCIGSETVFTSQSEISGYSGEVIILIKKLIDKNKVMNKTKQLTGHVSKNQIFSA